MSMWRVQLSANFMTRPSVEFMTDLTKAFTQVCQHLQVTEEATAQKDVLQRTVQQLSEQRDQGLNSIGNNSSIIPFVTFCRLRLS